jgi:hypothetical protein
MKLGRLKDGRAVAAIGERCVSLATLGFPGRLTERARSGSDELKRLYRDLETGQIEGESM